MAATDGVVSTDMVSTSGTGTGRLMECSAEVPTTAIGLIQGCTARTMNWTSPSAARGMVGTLRPLSASAPAHTDTTSMIEEGTSAASPKGSSVECLVPVSYWQSSSPWPSSYAAVAVPSTPSGKCSHNGGFLQKLSPLNW